MSVVTAPIASIVPATPRSRLLTIDLRGHMLDFVAGQAVVVGAHGQSDRRPYSIASSPERAAETGALELLIALEASGELSANLTAAAPGMLVDVEGPMGAFTFPLMLEYEWMVCVAGGTGIAPIRAMLDHALRLEPAPRAALLYSARRPDEFAFLDELRAHADAGRLELHPTVTRDQAGAWSGRRGRIGRSHFEAVLHKPAVTLCFVCGPPALVEESVGTLKAFGVPDRQIRTERWAIRE